MVQPFKVRLSFWRERIVAVTVFFSNLAFLVVNANLFALFLSNFASSYERFFLSRSYHRCTFCIVLFGRPIFAMSDNMNLFCHFKSSCVKDYLGQERVLRLRKMTLFVGYICCKEARYTNCGLCQMLSEHEPRRGSPIDGNRLPRSDMQYDWHDYSNRQAKMCSLKEPDSGLIR